MVFESLVVELINRFLGDFVENLDTSQLKIGIWGGDVVLNNLNLKESALDDLDLPVKIKAGHIGKLVLKIPWKNLYTEAVIAEIDGIYALALPNIGIKYNAEKEELAMQEEKQKKLLQIEEAKKIRAQKGQPQEEKKDTFAEKLVTQVIKNLQVKVSNIHIRYEDRYTNPRRPFAIGLSLQELLFQTTDENWKPSVIKEAVTQIYKLVRLDCLSVYWNSNTELLDGLEREEILETMKCNIAGPGFKTGYQYVVRPISAVAHLRLHTKPEQSKFTVPKIGLTVVFDEIAVGLTKDQYDDVLEMLESMERMNLLALHRKHRPDVDLKGHAKEWWLYAYFCVLDDTVCRRRDMWSWDHISHHRLVMKRYREAYVQKLDSKKIGADVQKVIDDCEKYLDVFCITLMRQQAEMQAAKLGAKRKEEAQGGWFGGLFGGGASKRKDSKIGNVASQEMQSKFYELYSGEEKAKLYSAIGYEENEADLSLPVEYFAVRVITKLRNMTVFLRDTRQKEQQLLKLQLKDVYSSFGQRPAASAILLEAKVDKMIVSGCPQADFIPKMITSQVQEKEQVCSLLTLAVETNPLDASCDTSIKVKARPLEIVYDAETINKLSVFFRPPKSVELKQFSQAAMARFDEIKEQSTSGIQHAIESHKYTSINIHLMSSYVIVPEGGIMKENVKMLVLDLGHLKVSSEKHDVAAFSKESMEDKIAKAYDKMNISLRNIQLLFVQPGQAWQAARDLGESPMHILNPVTLSIDVRQCILDKDPRFPKMKVLGELPSIQVSLTDTAIHNVLNLVTSIPLPESPPDFGEEDDVYKSMMSLPKTEMGTTEIFSTTTSLVGVRRSTKLLSNETSTDSSRRSGVAAEKVNFLDIELIFEIKQIMVGISRTLRGRERPYLNLTVNRLGTSVVMRTFDMTVNAYIGSISLQQLQYRLTSPVMSQLKMVGASANEVIHIINTPIDTNPDGHLLRVKYLQANKKAPDFHTTYKSTEQSVSIHFRSLELLLHQDSILSLMDFANRMAPPAAPKKPAASASAISTRLEVTGTNLKKMSSLASMTTLSTNVSGTPRKTSRKMARAKPVQVIDISVEAELCQFSVGICNDSQLITHLQVKGIKASVIMMVEKMIVSAVLQDLVIFDPDPDTQHQKILRIEGSEVLNADIVLFNDGTSGEKYSDLSCVDTSVAAEIGCIKVVFVNKFVNSLLDFVNNFTEAQEKIAKAGQAAAQAGLDAVHQLQETAARLKLSVRMKAPVILVPQSSKSFNSLMLDFGLLTVSNGFQLAGAVSSAGVPAVLEHMKVELTDLKLSRALIQADGSVKSECIMLEPVSFTLLMQRNLSGAWYHDQPDIKIGGALERLTAHLSQGDYATIMQVLNENLNEGIVAAPPPQAPRPSQITTARFEDTQVLSAIEPEKSKKPLELSPVPEVIEESASSTESYTSIKVDFQLKGLCAFFYTGDTVLSSGKKSHDPAKILGKFELQLLTVAASIMSDNAVSAVITLMDTIVDDMRVAKQTGITRMIERSKTATNQSATMITVDYSANHKGSQKVRLGISSLYICVCVEFLMTLANFFTAGLAASLPSEVEYPAVVPEVTAGEGDGPTKPSTSQGSMEIVLDMDKPEIILIEDQLNFDTKALVVDLMLSFRLRQMPDEQVMSAGITKMEIFSCTFSNRTNRHTQVLMPCDITLHSNAKFGKNPHMAVSLTDMVLNISASTIETISTIAAGMSVPNEATDVVKREYATDRLWQKKKISECKFWFLSHALGSDVDVAMPDMKLDFPAPISDREEELDEQLILTLPSLVVKMEGGVGRRTIPLLIVESCLQAQVRNWSGEMSVEAELDLEVGYYNERLAVWEPIIEPVLHETKFRRWKLNLEVRQNASVNSQLEDSMLAEAEEQVVVLPSKMVVNVSSVDALQICFTKTCLEVLTNLGMSFNDAYNLVKKEDKKEETVFSPYVLRNQTGYEFILKLDPSFEMPPSAAQGKVKLGPGAVLPVFNKVEAVSTKTKASMIKATQEGDERKIIFQVEQFNATREVTIKRAEKRLFQINQRTNDGDVWAVICHTECTIGQKFITLQSILSVRNELTFPVEVFYRGDTQLESCGIVQPEGTFSLPLNVVYSISNDLFFKPVSNKYKVSEKPINWRSLEKDGAQQVSCPTVSAGHSPCFFCVYPEVESVYFELGDEKTAKCYILSLESSVFLHNLLPFSIKYMLEGTEEQDVLEMGQNQPLMHASINDANLSIEIPSYKGVEWLANRKLQKNMPELTVIEFCTYKGVDKTVMEMGLHCKMNKASLDVIIYSPYWLLNKTDRTLFYRGSDQDGAVQNDPEEGQLTLFSFAGKSGKKKAQLKIADLEWSDKFSLDTVGSSGTVACKSKAKDTTGAEVGVTIHLSSSGLTKIVTFTPFYMFLNTALETILVSEANRDNWVEIPPGQCQPYWPQISGKEITVKAKVRDTVEQTGPFPINQAHATLLRLDNKHGGINAECQVSEASMITTLQTYRPGLATVTVINHTHESTITFYQSGEQQKQTVTLQTQEVILYTWDNALGKRELVWSCGKKKDVKNDLTQDGMDEFFADEDTKIYWVTFLDGLQRILLFTEDLAVAANAKEALQAGEMDQMDQEINLEIQGLGLSLVDNIRQVEVAFLGITSSGIIWEERRKRRYKALKLKDCLMLEAAWQKYQMELAVGKNPNHRILLENKMEVDFVDMTVVRPKTFPIRRSFENGIWVQYKTSQHQMQVHAKINRMQLDNQLRHAVFPTVLSPLPPPKSVAAESVPKPFMELSIMIYTHEHSSVSQFKYFKVLIQEMNVKVDQGFLNALLQLFSPANSPPREQETIEFKQDLLSTEKTLMMVAGLSLAEEQKNFYDYLHFSPIKIHLSFSLHAGSDEGKPTELQAGVLNVFLQSVGVVLTDIQDVVFKLGYFERSHTFYNQSQLTSQMIRHYASQAIKQMYVLVLGLDVLGNPFGLLRGLSEGIEDLFYEPYQGAIQGPEEFAEGLALGVRSLFGHAVGGAAGAVSRITGTLGKGMATLTLDDEYQKQRREAMTKKPASAREGFARGGKGLVMGVFDGVTGIVRKPVEGAKQEGVTGFFKGMGKGLVGVVTRPTSGMIDFASSSFEGIRRITDINEEIRRLRPPRRFFKDKVIRPYNHQEAEGYVILSEIDKGQYITSDEYKAHVVLTKDGKSVLVVTDRRVLMAKRGELFGAWDAEWMFVWVDLREDTPQVTSKGIEIALKVKEKKFFSSGSAKKEVHIPDPKVAEWIAGKIREQIVRLKS